MFLPGGARRLPTADRNAKPRRRVSGSFSPARAQTAHGGTADINPVQDLGFLYNRNLADPDGHVWEAMFMDMEAMPTE